jgi:anti-sigma factor RsiW
MARGPLNAYIYDVSVPLNLGAAGPTQRNQRVRASSPQTGIHELLPWYANGTLQEKEAAAFREHLAGCEGCRAEMEVIGKIRGLIDEHGEAFLEDHPPAEVLVAALRGEIQDAERVARVRRHIALCAACAAEARWVAGDGEPAGVLPSAQVRTSPPGRAGLGRWLAFGAAAAATLAAAVLFGPWRRAEEPAMRVVRPVYVRPAARAAAAENVFSLAPGASHVDLLLEVDLAPESFPARMEIADARGKVLHVERVEREVLIDGAFLLLDCPRRVCSPGTYVVRITAAGGRERDRTYGFRVTAP